MNGDVAVRVRELTKVYKIYPKPIDRLKEALNPFKKNYHREHYALNRISFDIERGEIVGIVGTNGSGKSTLLKIITGVLKETSGEINVNGRVSALLELGAGFNLEYTGLENIYFNGLVMGFTRAEMDRKVNAIIEFADIGEFIEQPVKTYSNGMFARLAFAVAINVEPEILIIDETLSVGDMYFQAKCISKMKEMFDRGVTVIFVTHDTNAVKSLCRKALYLDKGNFIAYGPSDEIVDLYSKNVREEMMVRNSKLINNLAINSTKDVNELAISKNPFKEDPGFTERVSYYRQGTMDAELVNLEVFNEKKEVLDIADFNEQILIRFYIKFHKTCRVSIGYHIRDNMNIEILGSNTVFENVGEICAAAGDRLIVDFSTAVPLIEGIYNISTVISTPTIHNRSALFVDYTENAYVFHVSENLESKLWNKVYVPNEITITRVDGGKNE